MTKTSQAEQNSRKSNLAYFFNRLRAIQPNGYQRGSLEKSHQNGDYLKQAMRKSCLPAGFEPAAFGLPVHCCTT